MQLRITQDLNQHHHKQNYMWLNVCDLPEKIILAKKKTSKEVDFSDFISTFAMSSRVSYAFCDTKICEISAMTKS